TDTSSLGTVELWIWHVRGGQGVQITKKDAQPHAADPAFEKEGRFLFFSGRGGGYQYNRDPYEGFWQIKCLDRKTRQLQPLTGEVEAAATPLAYPDGKQLAFIRRVEAKTALEVMD